MEATAKVKLINRMIGASLIIQVLISKPVWVNSLREFPTAPVLPGFELGFGGTILIVVAMMGCVGLLFRPMSKPLILGIVGVMLVLVLEDVSRLQPWLYLYGLMLLGTVLIRGKEAGSVVLTTVLLILGVSYFWSGVQKLNFFFGSEMFPWLAEFLGQEAYLREHPEVGYVVGAIEALAGLGVLFQPVRKVASVVVLLMHGFILVSLGPLGHDWNQVVWPWNLCFAAILVTLVWIPETKKSFIPTSGYTLFCLVLVGIMPVLGLLGKWDHFLSGGFYSSAVPDSIFYYHESDREKMPASSADFQLFFPDTEEEFVLIDQWALDHLGVPIYPEKRVEMQVAGKLCDCVSRPDLAGLRINYKHRFSGESETMVVPCREL